MKISDARSQTIGGPDGVIVSFEGVPEGGEVPIKGFVAGIDADEWQYLFVALSVLEEWSFQGRRLKAALDTVQFTGQSPPTTVPPEAFAPDSWEPDDSTT